MSDTEDIIDGVMGILDLGKYAPYVNGVAIAVESVYKAYKAMKANKKDGEELAQRVVAIGTILKALLNFSVSKKHCLTS